MGDGGWGMRVRRGEVCTRSHDFNGCIFVDIFIWDERIRDGC